MTSPTASGAALPAVPFQITKKMLQALAPLPATAVRLLTLLDDPNASMRRMGEVASQDVGIAAAILRMANSPVLGMRGRVGSIGDALTLIGTEQARLLVLSCGVAQAGQKELRLYGLASGAFLRHSELVATLSMAIARQARYSAIGVAYSAGLLHDVGKVILNGLGQQADPASPMCRQFTQAMQGSAAEFMALERNCFGIDHPSVGHEAAALWALPVEIAEAIRLHHTSTESGEPTLAAFVALANAVAGAADPGYPAAQRVPLPEQPIVPVEPLIALAGELVK